MGGSVGGTPDCASEAMNKRSDLGCEGYTKEGMNSSCPVLGFSCGMYNAIDFILDCRSGSLPLLFWSFSFVGWSLNWMELDKSSNCKLARLKNVCDGMIGNGPVSVAGGVVSVSGEDE